MSDLFTPNQDSYRGTHAEGSAGPLMGFMDAFDAAWTSQTKVHSFLAVEQSMRAIEQEQIKRIREAGLKPPRSLDDGEDSGTGPFGGAQFKQGRYSAAAQSVLDGGGWYTDEMVSERDKEIEALKKSRPDLGLMTYSEMFGKVREQSLEIERRNAGPTTLGGTIGQFVGTVAGAMNPVSDPLNVASMALTGGQSVGARIALQGFGSAGVEAGSMAINPNSENILLGRNPTFGEDLTRIGVGGLGGAAGQAIGEGIGAGVRRLTTGKWFADLPPPEAPPAPRAPVAEIEAPIGEVAPPVQRGRAFSDYPDWETFVRSEGHEFDVTYGKTRDAKLRYALDLDHVTIELNRWDGPRPFEVTPARTDTAVIREADTTPSYQGATQRYIDSLDTVDDIARRIDPDLFRQYDKLVQQRDEMRGRIESEAAQFRGFQTSEAFFDAGAAEFKARDMAARAELQKIDEQMRDLAPLVSRAYGAAEKEWRATPMDWNTLRFMQQLENRSGFRYRGEGEPSLLEKPAPLPRAAEPIVPARTVGDAVPLAKLSPELEARVKLDANADAPTRVAAAVAEDAKVMDEKVEAFVGTSSKVAKLEDVEIADKLKALREKEKALDPKAENAAEQRAKLQEQIDELTGVTLPDGTRLDFKDKVPYVDETGVERQMSVLDFLREMQKDQDALQSVVTCSRPS